MGWQPRALSYRPQFDGIRAIAIGAVLVGHLYWPHAPKFLPGFGVSLFFVLSGFLITRILLADLPAIGARALTVRRALGNFYARRTLRLFPIYYLTLAIAFAANIGPVRADILWLLTYTFNILQSMTPWILPIQHFWSLAVEEQFYLIWAPAVFLLGRRGLVAFVIMMLAGAVLYRYAITIYLDGSMELLIFGRMDYLAAGALLAIASATMSREAFAARITPWRPYLMAGAIACVAYLVAPPLLPSDAAGATDHTVWAALLTMMIGYAYCEDRGPVSALLASPPLIYLGRISYGVYIVHLFPPYLISTNLFRNLPVLWRPEVQCILFASLAIGIAALSWHFFEAPINRVKDRFRGAPSVNAGRSATAGLRLSEGADIVRTRQ